MASYTSEELRTAAEVMQDRWGDGEAEMEGRISSKLGVTLNQANELMQEVVKVAGVALRLPTPASQPSDQPPLPSPYAAWSPEVQDAMRWLTPNPNLPHELAWVATQFQHLAEALNEAHAEVERVTMDLTERTVERDAAQEWRLYNADAAERIMERAKAAESERDEARAALAAAEREINRLATFLSDEASTLRAHHVGRDAIENPVDAAHLADVIDETLAASRTDAADKENDHA